MSKANFYAFLFFSLAADVILFNSAFNQESFLSSIRSFLNSMPDYKPGISIIDEVRPKCKVLYFPISFPKLSLHEDMKASKDGPLHIVWAHRWFVLYINLFILKPLHLLSFIIPNAALVQ